MASPKIDYCRPEYEAELPKWNLVADCLAGQMKIKEGKDKYLPRPNKSDKSEWNRERYEEYLARAVFYGVTQRTSQGMVGHVFQVDPVSNIPAQLEIIEKNIDGSSVNLEQQAKKALEHVLAFGRCGLLTDYPKTNGEVTVADQATGKIRPTVNFYTPFQIINWRTVQVGAEVKLSLLVLNEQMVASDDGYKASFIDIWRELRLTDVGVTVQKWRKRNEKDQGTDEFISVEGPDLITDSSGKTFEEIPFTFIGPVNNDSMPDRPPLYDLAELNVAHYRNSADLEEAGYICGQPTLVLSGVHQEWVDKNLKGKAMLGSRGGIPLPQGGDGKLLQASENSLIKEIMLDKERQMVALGAQLIEAKQTQRTATDAKIEDTAKLSTLGSCAKNVSSALTKSLQWCQRFMGIDNKETSYQLDSKLSSGKLSSEELNFLVNSWQKNAIAFEEMREGLKASGLAYLDDKDASAKIKANPAIDPATLKTNPK